VKTWSFLLLLLALTFPQGNPRAAALDRVPNATLSLPLELPKKGYRLVDAFPGQTVNNPLVLTAPPGETNRLFFAQRNGQIYYFTNLATPTKVLFLDLSHLVVTDGEGGLTGLAFHPRFAETGEFFVFYTRSNRFDETPGLYDQVSKFRLLESDPTRADPDSEVSLIAQFDEHPVHQAGDLQFGPDGYLYISIGDEGSGADTIYRNSQKIDKDFFSAILRIDVDKKPGSLPPNPHPAISDAYAVPPDNPFVGATSFNGKPVDPAKVRTEFWAVGFRNPYRITFDPLTGALFCAEVGQADREEINLITKGGNYGWFYFEGTLRNIHRTETPPAGFEYIWPLYEYDHNASGTYDPLYSGLCVIGGITYRGVKLAQLHGKYIFGDLISRHIWSLDTSSSGSPVVERLLTHNTLIYGFGRDPRNGDLLVAELGKILRLEYSDDTSGEPPPAALSETGAFTDLATLNPHAGIVPYEVNHPFWSDNAIKSRWFSIPDASATMEYHPSGPWSFPDGSVWIKHFEIETIKGDPSSRRRLETRFIVKNPGGVYGITYRWNSEQTDAFLVPEEGMDEVIEIMDEGGLRNQVWRYPARAECLTCHNQTAGHVLGFSTRQLNLTGYHGENQIAALAGAGYFSNPPSTLAGAERLAAINDSSATLLHRVRSYLDANCSYCHQPGGAGRGYWDARISTPLHEARIIDGAVMDDLGIPGALLLKPAAPGESVLLERISRWEGIHMPPLATALLNEPAIDLLQEWLTTSAFVRDRLVFYNDSAWDGNRVAADAGDDSAIAIDKSALFPMQTAAFANYTSFNKGINGMIDVSNLASPPTLADFSFLVGNEDSTENWSPAPPPREIAIRPGAGRFGSDRVTIVWDNQAITNTWLQVVMEANATTGLEAPDVFYFGNAIGETGNEISNARVDPADELLARASPRTLFDPAPIDFPLDFNRDMRVDPADQLIARAHGTTVFNELKLITPSGSTPNLGIASLSGTRWEAVAASRPRLRATIQGQNLLIVLPGVQGEKWELQYQTGPEWRTIPSTQASRPTRQEDSLVWSIPMDREGSFMMLRARRQQSGGLGTE
jgi:glucose/arabinose dehydrogenase